MNVSHTRPFSALEDRKPRSTTPRQVRAALVAVDYLFETKTKFSKMSVLHCLVNRERKQARV